MKYDQIKQIFTNLDILKINGIWFSGIENEGEYKSWYANGNLYIHCFYKDSRRNGEYKVWDASGKLIAHRLYKDDKIKGHL